jgi:hypothetical protein
MMMPTSGVLLESEVEEVVTLVTCRGPIGRIWKNGDYRRGTWRSKRAIMQ